MTDLLTLLEDAVKSELQIALLRRRLLLDDDLQNKNDETTNMGLPTAFLPLVYQAVQAFLAVADMSSLVDCLEAIRLDRILHVHLKLVTMDVTLREELEREGCSLQLVKLIEYDAARLQSEANQDIMIAFQDMAGEIIATGSAFGRPSGLPFTRDELLQRLPLQFDIGHDDATISIWIHQVTSRQSAQEDVGFVMWPSSVILAKWLACNPETIRGLRVLELGSGCGLVGLVAAHLAAKSVYLTDFNRKVLSNMERNVSLNNLSSCCRVIGLDFYHQSGAAETKWTDLEGELHDQVDVVIGADIICKPDDAYAAARAVKDCLKEEGKAFIVCATSEHRFGVDHFETACHQIGFEVKVQHVEDLYKEDDDLLTDLKQTSGYVEGMRMEMFVLEKAAR